MSPSGSLLVSDESLTFMPGRSWSSPTTQPVPASVHRYSVEGTATVLRWMVPPVVRVKTRLVTETTRMAAVGATFGSAR